MTIKKRARGPKPRSPVKAPAEDQGISDPATLVLTKRLLAAVHAAHPEQTRYAMNGLLISEDGTVVATDGKIMVTLRGKDKHSGITPRALHRADVLALRGKLVRKTDIATLQRVPETRSQPATPTPTRCGWKTRKEKACTRSTCQNCKPDPDTVEDVGVRQGVMAVRQLADSFPPWRKVIPKPDQEGPYVLDIARADLEEICEPLAAVDNERPTRWHVWAENGADVSGIAIEVRLECTADIRLTYGRVPSDPASSERDTYLGLDPSLTMRLCRVAREAGIESLKIKFPVAVKSSLQGSRGPAQAKDAVVLRGSQDGVAFFGLQMPINLCS